MLKNIKWCDYHLYDLFYIYSGNKFDKSKMTTFDPTVDFVGRSSKNNGVTAHVDYIDGVKPYPAGCMTIALGGEYLGSCFIQRHPFYTSQNVVVLSEKQSMSENVKLFISHLIRFESKNKYMAFARELNSHIKNDFIIKLPSLEEGKVDYDYIDKYIGSLSFDISSIPDYFLNEGYNRACWYMDNINQHDFEQKYRPSFLKDSLNKYRVKRKTKPYSLNKLFSIEYPKTLVYAEMQPSLDGINFVSSKGENNGVVGRVERKNGIKIYPKGCITVPLKGSVLSTSIQQEECYVAHQTAVLTPIHDMSIYVKMYIITLINANKFRFNYGRQADNTLKELQIELPVNENEKIDWVYIENYIKSLPYSANI